MGGEVGFIILRLFRVAFVYWFVEFGFLDGVIDRSVVLYVCHVFCELFNWWFG